jgi:Fe-S cluster assembly scaffold protein SufB
MCGAVKATERIKKQTSPGRPRFCFVRTNSVTQLLVQEDYETRYESACRMLQGANNVTCSDEATLHISGHMNRYHCRVWGSKNPSVIMEHERASAKMNVFYVITHRIVIDTFFRMKTLSPAAPTLICWKFTH